LLDVPLESEVEVQGVSPRKWVVSGAVSDLQSQELHVNFDSKELNKTDFFKNLAEIS